jgi:hypothetical protein
MSALQDASYIVERELDKSGPTMLQSHVRVLAEKLAERLCRSAGGGLKKAYFGSDGVEATDLRERFHCAEGGAAGGVVELDDTSPAFWTEALNLSVGR